MTSTNLFARSSPAGELLTAWWQDLQQNRGDRAELRRCHSPDDAVVLPVTINLITQLRHTPVAEHRGWMNRIPLVAGLSAHLDADEPTRSLPERMASRTGDRPVVSQIRFRRLLRTPRRELYRPMIRILALIERRANLCELAESMFWWGPRIQKEWALAYFPNTPQTTTH
ncbi:MAG: type I-E CRISPR-associated protein Cse2/CasB [Candidatus Dadabacteria bacterium]|nr:MAG: type I-E CRISPR-associated protein Cse2/CasB [Candidatus Dadabacteria bacterium]